MHTNNALADHDLFGNALLPDAGCILKERFIIPPFSVLNAREGDWQERKRRWISLGIKGERGREDGECFNTDDWFSKNGLTGAEKGNISIFDPVLCELMYKWFAPPSGKILDPFCGGSVRGIVASVMGYKYTGLDLRAEQIAENEKQAEEIYGEHKPRYVCGNAESVKALAYDNYDFVFSCPPYGNLEVYSDDPRDLSTMPHDKFLESYRAIIKDSCDMLENDRFACFVVGDFRDKAGNYRNFISDTIQAFLDAGLKLYNHGILVTCVGSLPIRVTRQFESGRKLGNTHQNILVFVKGDGKKATQYMTTETPKAEQLEAAV